MLVPRRYAREDEYGFAGFLNKESYTLLDLNRNK